jgi:hypothetical protein
MLGHTELDRLARQDLPTVCDRADPLTARACPYIYTPDIYTPAHNQRDMLSVEDGADVGPAIGLPAFCCEWQATRCDGLPHLPRHSAGQQIRRLPRQ